MTKSFFYSFPFALLLFSLHIYGSSIIDVVSRKKLTNRLFSHSIVIGQILTAYYTYCRLIIFS